MFTNTLSSGYCPKCDIQMQGLYCLTCGSLLEKVLDQGKTSDQLIRVETIHKSFLVGKTPVYALRGASMTITKGEFLAIMGPSGSGKSTLLHLIGALDIPTEGHIFFNDQNLSTFNDKKLASYRLHNIGFVFQSFNLAPSLSILENVLLPIIFLNKQPKKEQEAKALNLLNIVGLLDRKDHFPSEISGGEQQRVALARAIANNPTLLLADEPTGNLDSMSGKMIIDLLKTLNKSGQTICMVTHDNDLASEADRIIHIFDGKITEQ
jgi:putative ABC transport system ATP-binding protein